MRYALLTAAIVTGILLAWTGPARAGDTYWNVGDSTWSTGANWTAGEPLAGDTAHVNNGGTVRAVNAGEVCNTLYIGQSVGETGTVAVYNLGTLTVGYYAYIGYEGTGTFTQTGTSPVDIGWGLYLGADVDSEGRYNLWGGQLSADYALVGDVGTGTFEQTAGTCTLSGSLGYLALGFNPGGDGTYTLSGTGSMSAAEERIGFAGTGHVTQTGGSNTVSGTLYLGQEPQGDGTYNLSGTGTVWADVMKVGDRGTGIFNQSGGTVTVASALILCSDNNSHGTYNLSGGQLNTEFVTVGSYAHGVFNHTGGTHTVGGELGVGTGGGYSGEYNLSGGSTLTAPDEYVGRTGQGPGTFTQTAGSHTVTGTLTLGDHGTFDLRGGTLHVGSLVVDKTFLHSGGTSTVDGDFYLGYAGGETATYDLSGTASLTADTEYIGYYGTGTFTQTGGSHTVSTLLRFSYWNNAPGTYDLSGGQLHAAEVELGGYAVSTFNHSGGTHDVSVELRVGCASSWPGIYNLSGSGELTAAAEHIGRMGINSVFRQTGGTHEVAGTLWVDVFGLYDMQDGTLQAATVNLDGRFDLSGGSAAADVIDLFGGSSEFNFTGGTLSVGEFYGDLINAGGTVAPGGSPGATTVQGDYSQVAGSLAIQLGGTSPGDDSDILDVTGVAALGGTLELSLIAPFVPTHGEVYYLVTAAAVDGRFDTVVGAILGADLALAVTYGPTFVKATAAIPGDANLDGCVDGADYTLWADHYQLAGMSWVEGDFTGNSVPDGADYTIWADHYHAGCGSSVPEPATLMLLIAGAALAARRRR